MFDGATLQVFLTENIAQDASVEICVDVYRLDDNLR